MSYLNLPRVTFAGFFEADVNTVNNDVRNYDSEVFEARFQMRQVAEPGGRTEYNGWWNPDGSNAFRLMECAVTGAAGPGGARAESAAQAGTPAPSLRIEAQQGRTQAKIVDLDPQLQFASGLWGMRLSLMLGDLAVLSATLQPACFRDIYFGRVIVQSTGQPLGGSPSASARFTGTLTDLDWGPDAKGMTGIGALEAAADGRGGKLTMSLLTYGYSKSRGPDDFLVGSVVGSIGPYLPGDPEMFAPGRRFAPSASSANLPFASASGLGYMTGAVSPDGATFSLDFGNSIPMWLVDKGLQPGQVPYLALQDLGPLTVVVLKGEDPFASIDSGAVAAPYVSDGDGLTPDQYEVIGIVQGYDMAWLQATGGIADLPIPAGAAALIGDHSLAVLLGSAPAPLTIGIRETVAGAWVRADQFVQRVDTAETGWVSAPVSLWAMRWGKPWAGAPLQASLSPPLNDQGGTGDPKEEKPPQAVIPLINVPPDKVLVPATLTTGDDGVGVLNIQVENPGHPRGYVDGQIYQISYSLALTGQSPMPTFEFIAMHARDAYLPPLTPSWTDDIGPILVQYGNLYPVMSRGLFSFSDPLAIAANARLLHLAFTRPIEDPNYMPATRDLSAGKVTAILRWLEGYLPEAAVDRRHYPSLPEGAARAAAGETAVGMAAPTRLSAATAQAAIARLGPGNDGKTAAVRSFLKNAPVRDA
ncbi:MAG TPA: hypothetical protein VHG32_24665 [Thermoanaerobaculia bacterium]|jgi:hypothetical protein|nr:hypothetical protein [Thermoanaerobaculia bacterium]